MRLKLTFPAVNAVVLGAAGYFAYLHRNQVQTWDKKLLSAIAVGVATFVGGERYVPSATRMDGLTFPKLPRHHRRQEAVEQVNCLTVVPYL